MKTLAVALVLALCALGARAQWISWPLGGAAPPVSLLTSDLGVVLTDDAATPLTPN